MGETCLQIHSLTLNDQSKPCPITETEVEELLEHALVNERKSKNREEELRRLDRERDEAQRQLDYSRNRYESADSFYRNNFGNNNNN